MAINMVLNSKDETLASRNLLMLANLFLKISDSLPK
jgi:hypothetical protein